MRWIGRVAGFVFIVMVLAIVLGAGSLLVKMIWTAVFS